MSGRPLPREAIPAPVADRLAAWAAGTWYQRQAVDSIRRGWVHFIPTREGSELYFVRLWLIQPVALPSGQWDSGHSALLHWFMRGDDDSCLHDHPWDFRTSILSGGYIEHLPPPSWVPGSDAGPEWDARHVLRANGDTVEHAAEDLHCVGQVRTDVETWTLVRTGRRRREWGFHQQGQAWQSQSEFLGKSSVSP